MIRDCPRHSMSLVEVLLVIAILGVLTALGLAAVQQARAAALRAACACNLRQLGLALHQYHQVFGVFPPGISSPPGYSQTLPPGADPYPLMRWHGRILPFVEQEALWQETVNAYQQDAYFLNDPPHTGRTVWVPVFLCPVDSRRYFQEYTPEQAPATTSYVGVAGVSYLRHDGILFLDSAVHFGDVTDGTSNTLLIGERPANVDYQFGYWYSGWGHWPTAESTLGVCETGVNDWIPGCPGGPYAYSPGSWNAPCATFQYWSMHTTGANFVFTDGAVKFLPYSAAPLLPALATRAGGEIADSPD